MSAHDDCSSSREEGKKCLQEIWDHHMNNIPPPISSTEHDARPTDVILTSMVKSGTTLLLQMMYQIAVHSGGASANDSDGTNFRDQMQVAPWIEFAQHYGVRDIETSPRVFKTHSPLVAYLPLRCKHVALVRDPLALPGSFLDFLFDAIVTDADSKGDAVREATFDAFCEQSFTQPVHRLEMLPPNWHAFTKAGVHPLREDVLVIFYEDVVEKPVDAVRTLAKFMACDLSNAGVDKVVSRCDRGYMESDSKFYGNFEREVFKVPRQVRKVKPLRKTGFKRFQVKEEYAKAVEKSNMEVFGFRTYEEIRDDIKKRQFEQFQR